MSDSGLPRRLEETRPLSSAPGQRRESRWRVETAALRVPDSLSCAQPGPSTRRRRSRARSTGPSEPRRSAPPSALGTRRPASRPLSLARLAPSQAPPPPRRGATQACAAPRLSGGRVLPRPCRTGCRSDIATAHCITALMRWRSRRAVSGLWCQRGLSISSTSALVTSETGRSPIRGNACRSRLAGQSLACLGLRQPARFCSSTREALTAKVRMPRARRLSAIGSPSARASRRLARACSRASSSVTIGKLPSPSSHRRSADHEPLKQVPAAGRMDLAVEAVAVGTDRPRRLDERSRLREHSSRCGLQGCRSVFGCGMTHHMLHHPMGDGGVPCERVELGPTLA